ncbi:MAG: reductase, partial [Methanomassiliicoccales archaeon]
MNDRLHGKTLFHWCDTCNTLLLSPTCSKCKTKGRELSLSLPGDIRPALRRGHEVVSSLFFKHFGTDYFLKGKVIFLNKVAGEDRADEIVVDGHVVGAMRFDLKANNFFLEIRAPGAAMLRATARNGVIKAQKTEGHLKGKKIDGKDIVEVIGEFKADDPVLMFVGNTLCSGVAKVGSSDVMTAEKAVLIRDIAPADLKASDRTSGRNDFIASNKEHILALES